jgi:hypothetical protein
MAAHGGLRAWLTFRAQPTEVSQKYCHGTVELREPGTLEDGSGELPDAPGTSCKWLITAPEGHVTRFRFSALDTQPLVDQILFFVGPSTAGHMMAGFSGEALPPELVTWGRQTLMWFFADTETQGQGWRVSYTFEPAPRARGACCRLTPAPQHTWDHPPSASCRDRKSADSR